MTLNFDCIRAILLTIEKEQVYINKSPQKKVLKTLSLNNVYESELLQGFSHDDILYCTAHMFMDGIIFGRRMPEYGYNLTTCAIEGLTPKGQDLLKNIKNETVYHHVKSKTIDMALSTFSQVAGETAAAFAKRMLKL